MILFSRKQAVHGPPSAKKWYNVKWKEKPHQVQVHAPKSVADSFFVEKLRSSIGRHSVHALLTSTHIPESCPAFSPELSSDTPTSMERAASQSVATERLQWGSLECEDERATSPQGGRQSRTLARRLSNGSLAPKLLPSQGRCISNDKSTSPGPRVPLMRQPRDLCAWGMGSTYGPGRPTGLGQANTLPKRVSTPRKSEKASASPGPRVPSMRRHGVVATAGYSMQFFETGSGPPELRHSFSFAPYMLSEAHTALAKRP